MLKIRVSPSADARDDKPSIGSGVGPGIELHAGQGTDLNLWFIRSFNSTLLILRVSFPLPGESVGNWLPACNRGSWGLTAIYAQGGKPSLPTVGISLLGRCRSYCVAE